MYEDWRHSLLCKLTTFTNSICCILCCVHNFFSSFYRLEYYRFIHPTCWTSPRLDSASSSSTIKHRMLELSLLSQPRCSDEGCLLRRFRAIQLVASSGLRPTSSRPHQEQPRISKTSKYHRMTSPSYSIPLARLATPRVLSSLTERSLTTCRP